MVSLESHVKRFKNSLNNRWSKHFNQRLTSHERNMENIKIETKVRQDFFNRKGDEDQIQVEDVVEKDHISTTIGENMMNSLLVVIFTEDQL